MDTNWRTSLWQQFGARSTCSTTPWLPVPTSCGAVRLWDDAELPESAAFWYIVYHTLFWLDLYLTGAVEGFAPPAPFTLTNWTRRGCCPKGLIPGMSFKPTSNTAARNAGRRSTR